MTKAATLAAILGFSLCTAYAQGEDKTATYGIELPLLIVGDVELVDDGVARKGINKLDFSGMLRFLFAGDRTILIGSSEAMSERKRPARGFYLSSSLQTFQDAVLWTGTLEHFEGTPDPDKSIPLGPLTLADSTGTRPAVLNEMAALIRRSIGQVSISTRTLPVYRVSCFSEGAPADRFAADLASDLDVVLQKQGQLRSQGLEECGDAEAIQFTQRLLRNAVAVIYAAVSEQRERVHVQPELAWIPERPSPESREKQFRVPLPQFDETRTTLRDRRNRYLQLLGRSIAATLNHSPERDLELASEALASGTPAMWQAGSAMLERGNSPHLALALLQRGHDQTSFEAAYQLGKAYQAIREPAFAERHFRQSMGLAPADWTDLAEVQGELGTVLVELQKFKEAEVHLKELLERRDNHDVRVKYLRVARLLGNKVHVEQELQFLLSYPKPDLSVLAIAARSSLDTRDFEKAFGHIERAVRDIERDGHPAPEKPVFVELAKTLAVDAIAAQKADPEIAKKALDLVIRMSPDDALAYLMRGRAQLMMAELNNFSDIALAVRDLQKANLGATKLGKPSRDLAVVDLELAEAEFLGGNYRVAADIAEEFLIRQQTGQMEIASYGPVAHLLIVASGYLLTKIDDPREDLETRLQYLHEEKPAALTENVSTPWGQTVEVRIAEWSFAAFDKYVCQKLEGRKRSIVKGLSELVQKRLDTSADPDSCP